MRKLLFKTTVECVDEYKIVATQKIRDGRLEGGYTYAIMTGEHIINTGLIQCLAFSKGIPQGELSKVLESYTARPE